MTTSSEGRRGDESEADGTVIEVLEVTELIQVGRQPTRVTHHHPVGFKFHVETEYRLRSHIKRLRQSGRPGQVWFAVGSADSLAPVRSARPKAVVLRSSGECSKWGTTAGAVTPMDGTIKDARIAPFDEQRTLVHGCVRHLFDAQVRVPPCRGAVTRRTTTSASQTSRPGSAGRTDVRDAEKAKAVKAAFEV